MHWVRLWKDLDSLKSGWQNTVPVGAISGKRENLPTTLCRQLQSRNRWLHAGAFVKMTLWKNYLKPICNSRNGSVLHQLCSLILCRSGTLPHHAALLVHKRNHGSRTNGSVMRGFPLGIFYPAPEVYEVSLTCSRLTHYDPVGGHCSAFLNVMVSDMCRGVSRAAAFRHARSLCTNNEVHAVLGNYDQYDPDPSLDAVCSARMRPSILLCMRSRSEMAILSAVNLGGDADTVGACVVHLPGRTGGSDASPERWRNRAGSGTDELVQDWLNNSGQ